MVAELYILSESFANNATFSNAEIEEKVKSLASDFVLIKKHKETNKLLVHPDIYDVQFLRGVTLSDLLNDPVAAKKYIDRDVYNALKTIVIESGITNNTTQEVIDVLLPEHSENICHGLIAFNEVENIDREFQIVYNIQGWYLFRRYFLSIYPKHSIFFIDECVKYYPNLFFHEGNKQTIKTILNSCPKKIIYYLTALNDNFNKCITIPYNRRETLNRFNAISSFDQKASIEGDINKKRDLTFNFISDAGTSEQIYCEIHLKLLRDDLETISTNRRIYFHEGITNIQNGKILIGHIGAHL